MKLNNVSGGIHAPLEIRRPSLVKIFSLQFFGRSLGLFDSFFAKSTIVLSHDYVLGVLNRFAVSHYNQLHIGSIQAPFPVRIMLMQPQSPNKDFDFMLKGNQAPKKRLPLPSLNLPRPAKIGLAAVGAIFIIIVISSLLSGRKSGSFEPFVGVVARGTEILRVTTLTQQQLQLQDPQAQALAATVSAALASDKQQITSYLTKNHIKVSTAELAADTDKTTDASLQSASQSNSLDSAYVSYVQAALTKYESDLQAASKSAGPNGQKLLSASFSGARALLNSAPIKNS